MTMLKRVYIALAALLVMLAGVIADVAVSTTIRACILAASNITTPT